MKPVIEIRTEDEFSARDHFETFRTRFEACDADGCAEMIEVVTDIVDLCPELVDSVREAPSSLDEQVEWWNEWGARYHKAECDIREAMVRGYLKPRECEYDFTTDFEVCVGDMERLVELAQGRCCSEPA